MAIKLITGVPGSGKTLMAIKDIAEQVKANNDPKTPSFNDTKSTEENFDASKHKRFKRPIYTDIDGINFGEGEVYKVQPDHDWRECPDGSLIIYDEVHKKWRSEGQAGLSKNPQINDLDMHRHRGMDFILITQYPTKVHHEVRTNVTEHYHIKRPSGAKAATTYKWDLAQSSPNDFHAKNEADIAPFVFPKKYFKHYKSATIHTHKFKLPKYLVFLVIVGMVPIVNATYTTFTQPNLLNKAETPTQPPPLKPAPESQPAKAAAPVLANSTQQTTNYKQKLAGCISNANHCNCYADNYEILDLTYEQCIKLSNEPLPLPMQIQSRPNT